MGLVLQLWVTHSGTLASGLSGAPVRGYQADGGREGRGWGAFDLHRGRAQEGQASGWRVSTRPRKRVSHFKSENSLPHLSWGGRRGRAVGSLALLPMPLSRRGRMMGFSVLGFESCTFIGLAGMSVSQIRGEGMGISACVCVCV
jgi:hypothetical protein